jgi:hypothetical protein
MEWYVIEYLYPVSYKKFIDTMFPNMGMLSVTMLTFYDIKKLYKFFDKEEIFLTLEMLNKNQWCYTISLNKGNVIGTTECSNSIRDEIEKEGFTECFKILDNKLRKTYE